MRKNIPSCNTNSVDVYQLSALLGKSVSTIRNSVSTERLQHLIPPPLHRGGRGCPLAWDAAIVRQWMELRGIVWPDQEQSSAESELNLLSSKRAAELLDTSEAVLRNARLTGVLWGRSAPEFLKCGAAVRYRIVDLQKFIEAIPRFSSTAAISASVREGA